MTNQENVTGSLYSFAINISLCLKKKKQMYVFVLLHALTEKNSVISCGVDCTSRPRISRSDALPQNSIVS